MVKPNQVFLTELVAELDEQIEKHPLPSAAQQQAHDGGSFVLFGVLTSTFGVPVESVATVLQAPAVCRLPSAPVWLSGVFYWGGAVVPLLAADAVPELLQEGDLSSAQAPEEPARRQNRRCLVIRSGQIQLGLEVDAVFGVHRLELEDGLGRVIYPPPYSDESAMVEAQLEPGRPGSRLSDTLHWRVASASVPNETAEAQGSQTERIAANQKVRVLSMAGLLASDEITQFASRSALERGLGDAWSPSKPPPTKETQP